MTRWLTGLAALAVLASFPGAMDDPVTLAPTPATSSTGELPQQARPRISETRPLAVAEIRWCLSHNIQLETIRPRLATRRAIDYFNELAGDYNLRCRGYKYVETDRAEAIRDIEGSRAHIEAAALEDIEQLDNAGARTREAQELLEPLAYDPGATDGVYGTQTRLAIEAFQRDAGIPVDGLVSEELLQSLQIAHARHLAGRTERATTASAVGAPSTDVAGGNITADESPTIDVPIAGVATVEVAIVVMEETQEAVPDAEITVSNDWGFRGEGLTSVRGRAEFTGVPAGRLEVNVRWNDDRSRYAFAITEEPHQEVLIILPAH